MCSDKVLVIVLLLVSVCRGRDTFNNGKLSSGNAYWGNKYQHIIVEEKDQDKAEHRPGTGHSGNRWPSSGDTGNRRPSTGDSGTRWPSSGDTGTRWPSTSDSGNHYYHHIIVQDHNDMPKRTNGECFSLIKTRERIIRTYIRGTHRTRDRDECEDLCIRESYCRGFNYRYKSHGSYQYKDNCELSYEDTRGANRNDFNADDEFDFYEKSTNSRDCERGGGNWGNGGGSSSRDDECFRVGKSNYRLDNHVVKDSLNARGKQDCEEECLRANRFTCRAFAYRMDSYSGRTWGSNDRQDNCFLTDRGVDQISSYDFIYDRDSQIYEHDPYGRCDDYGREDNYYDHNGSGGRYTVNNLECYRGSRCREDHTAGYWWCEYDDSGAWDYCCRPDEACGRSRNYEDLFAWCYVGTGSSTQWRACEPGVTDRQYLKQDDPPNITTTYPSPSNDGGSPEVLDLDNIL